MSNQVIDLTKAIAKSERDGGIKLSDIAPDEKVRVTTRDTIYLVHQLADGKGWTIQGHPKYCPRPTRCNIHGSTWGGSAIKLNFIGVGMFLEVGLINDGEARTMLTSMIKECSKL